MNRRRFLQSLAAAFTLPGTATLSFQPAAAALPAAVAVPKNARFWAVYMSALHGECTPKTLQNLLHIPEVDAKRYVSQLISDGVIKPNPLLQDSISKVLKRDENGILEKAKKRLEMKSDARPIEPQVQEFDDETANVDEETTSTDELPTVESEVSELEEANEPEHQPSVNTDLEA